MSKVQFRKKALDKLNSPEEIDRGLSVMNQKMLFSLIGVSLLVVIAVVWGFMGSIPVYVKGTGIISQTEGIRQIRIPFNGSIEEVKVKVGDTIEQGQVLATIEQIDLNFEVRKLESNYRLLEDKLGRLELYLDESGRKGELKEIRNRFGLLSDSLGYYNDILYSADKDKYSSIKERIVMIEFELKDVSWKLAELEGFKDHLVIEVKEELDILRNALNQKKSELRFKSQIESAYSGIVIELNLDDGDIFSSSQTLMSVENIEDGNNSIEARIFVDALHGKKVSAGMLVYVSTSTFPKEEFGYILGRVSDVSKYPASREGLLRLLRNEEMVNQLTESSLPVYFTVNFEHDDDKNLIWSSGDGPQTGVLTGTLANARILVEEKKPISFVVPSLN